MNINSLQKMTKSLGGILQKNSPAILTGLGVAGLIGTVVMAVKATPKALEIIEEESRNKQRVLARKEEIELAWKCYLPTIGMGLLTAGCIIAANRVNAKRHAALLGLYSMSETALKEYQAKVVETIGEKKNRVIKDKVMQEKVEQNPPKDTDIICTGVGDTLCYDALTGRYFKSDIEHIRQVLNKLSRDLMSDMFISLNNVYYELGLKGIKLGEHIGWHIDDGLIEPDFTSHLTDNGKPCLVLDFENDPRYTYME